MTPEQALQILDQAASKASLERAGHATVQQAIMILAKALEKEPEKTEDESTAEE
jgi:hypothetical protein